MAAPWTLVMVAAPASAFILLSRVVSSDESVAAYSAVETACAVGDGDEDGVAAVPDRAPPADGLLFALNSAKPPPQQTSTSTTAPTTRPITSPLRDFGGGGGYPGGGASYGEGPYPGGGTSPGCGAKPPGGVRPGEVGTSGGVVKPGIVESGIVDSGGAPNPCAATDPNGGSAGPVPNGDVGGTAGSGAAVVGHPAEAGCATGSEGQSGPGSIGCAGPALAGGSCADGAGAGSDSGAADAGSGAGAPEGGTSSVTRRLWGARVRDAVPRPRLRIVR